MADDLRYTKDHLWVRVEGETARVGLSAFAQGELGEVAYVQLPAPGRVVRAGEAVCAIDSMKSTSEVCTPVSGTVRAVNTVLLDATEVGRVNSDPEGEGWLFLVTMEKPAELGELLSAEQYRRYAEGA